MSNELERRENALGIHLIILFSYTFFCLIVMAHALMLGWEIWTVPVLIVGLLISWSLHIAQTFDSHFRLWIYAVMNMLALFFYGVHPESFLILSLLSMMPMATFVLAGRADFIRLTMVVYYATMAFNVLLFGRELEMMHSRLAGWVLLHFTLEFLVGWISMQSIKKRNEDEQSYNSRINELREANKRTEDFLTNVSHELRTPINAVTGITSIMLKNETNMRKKMNLMSIQGAGNRLSDQISDIMDTTEIATGRLRVVDENYMMSSLTNDLIMGFKLMDAFKDLELIVDVDPFVPSILLGDGRKVKKILRHLIDNALKFTRKGGVYVRISSCRKEYGINLNISVQDTGVGMTSDEIDRVKEKFYQSDSGRSRTAGGLGLGMSIINGLTVAMGGFLQIDSEKNKGSVVRVSIPQKVTRDNPCMVIASWEKIGIACYIWADKFKITEVRDYYFELVTHLEEGLSVPVFRVTELDELERLINRRQVTHVFLGWEEYEKDTATFDQIGERLDVIVVAGSGVAPWEGSRVRLLSKPINSFSIVNIVNEGRLNSEKEAGEGKMSCPGVRALIVDDEIMNLVVAKGLLKDYKIAVETAESGIDALKAVKDGHYDLIFMDHMMPEMDGVETMKRIRRYHEDRDMAIIALTANAVSGAREMFLSEGFDEFVAKPIEQAELERVLKKVLPESAIAYEDDKPEPVHSSLGKADSALVDNDTEDVNLIRSQGIDAEEGMSYCMGSLPLYKELVSSFCEQAEAIKDGLDAAFRQERMEDYRAIIRSVRDTASLIGAEDLRYLAERAEDSILAGDVSEMEYRGKRVYEEYRRLANNLRAIELKDDGQKGDKENSLRRLIGMLKGCLATYEADRATEILNTLRGIHIGDTYIEDLLNGVRRDVDNIDLHAAAVKVEEIERFIDGTRGFTGD
ncbi:MAG: response regulator [Lachnospiraceae bacterium]|nr:response regulator [Lachnospiraceae bacterium]